MTNYSILLNVEGNMIEIECRDKSEYKHWSNFLQEHLPDKDWREIHCKNV